MFGIFRFLLASMVAISHLTSGYYLFSYYGFYAVFGFYCVSGYLMTSVLQKVYGYDSKGSANFWINRLLRIFPSYYVVALTAFLIISIFPRDAVLYTPAYKISSQIIDVLGNVLLFPFEFYQPKFRLIPPSWSIGVELLAYFLLWLFISRSKYRAIATFILSLGYVGYAYWAALTWSDRYFPLSAALLPFSIGAMIYYFLPEIKNFFYKLPRWMILLSILLLLTHLIVAEKIPWYPLGAGFYVNLILMAFVVAQLAVLESGNDLVKRVDAFLGNLSYPLFLTHSLVGFVVSLIFTPHLQYGLSLLAFSYPLTIIASILISKYIDEPIQIFRVRRRNRNLARNAPPEFIKS